MMNHPKHKVFISYHHENDQHYKNALVEANRQHNIFIDKSVNTGGIADDLPDQSIRQLIRDDYLRDSTVTIVLIGTETAKRKHVDWEIYSSMYNGLKNKKSGILIVNLPSLGSFYKNVRINNDLEKSMYPPYFHWYEINSIAEVSQNHPYLPERLTENILTTKVSIIDWETFFNLNNMSLLIDHAHHNRTNNEYDLRTQMKRRNS